MLCGVTSECGFFRQFWLFLQRMPLSSRRGAISDHDDYQAGGRGSPRLVITVFWRVGKEKSLTPTRIHVVADSGRSPVCLSVLSPAHNNKAGNRRAPIFLAANRSRMRTLPFIANPHPFLVLGGSCCSQGGRDGRRQGRDREGKLLSHPRGGVQG